MGDSRSLQVHVVTHTHWDREWYHPHGRFRQRLVALIDELLSDSAAGPRCFLLDGQSVVLEDYLAVRPDRVAELSERLRSNAIEAGPWYVLADGLIPGGESLVRNLLAGRRVLRALRASPPPVLYCPDSFGHPAALPMIARGFGLETVIVWRGLGGESHPRADTMRWQAADGSAVLVYHLPPSGYELGSSLPADPDAARERWNHIREQLAPRSVSGVTLLPNGADHHAMQLRYTEALSALASAAEPYEIIPNSITGFVEAHARASAKLPLPEVAGELRDSYGYAWTLQGTFAARASQKRRAATTERLLLREVEPFAALARRRGGADRRALVQAAWRSLLLCHPHDTLCGCSVDDVARDMDVRLADARSQGEGIRDDAIADLTGHDPVLARERGAPAWQPIVVVRNRAARARSGVAELEVDTFVRDVPVGPGSGAAGPPGVPDDAAQVPLVPAAPGVPFQTLARERTHSRTESARHYPDNDLVERARVVAWTEPVPGYGVRAIPLAPGRTRPPWPTQVVSGRGRVLDNGMLRVEATADAVTVIALGTSATATGRFVGFDDVADRGDLYTHSPDGLPRQATLIRARLGARGPLRAELETVWRIWIVPSATPAATGAPRRRPGGSAGATSDVTVTFVLDAGAPFVRVRIRGRNPIGDHRMRALFASSLTNAEVVADAAFGPVVRRPIGASADARRMESPPATAPLHRYVSVYGADGGMTVFSDGLAEYEASDGMIAITLIRAVGELSRNDLPERPGHAGWPAPTPEAQSLGPFAAEFAMLPHGARSPETSDVVERIADDVLLPLVGTTLRSALQVPPPVEGVELEGQCLAFSSLKDSEDGRWVVLRCVNLSDEERPGTWRLGFPIEEAMMSRLDETPSTPLSFEDRSVPFVAAARAVTTILVR